MVLTLVQVFLWPAINADNKDELGRGKELKSYLPINLSPVRDFNWAVNQMEN